MIQLGRRIPIYLTNIVIYTPETVTCLKIYTSKDISRLLLSRTEDVLGTIGSLAPFHSQMQNRDTTKIPEINVARTIAECHGKVIPPFSNHN